MCVVWFTVPSLLLSPAPCVLPINALARTPLNTMFLGLRLVIDDLATSRRTADKDRLDTLQDVVHACEVGSCLISCTCHAAARPTTPSGLFLLGQAKQE
jgi:hypothetical protein